MQVAAEVCQETEWKDCQLLHYLACAYAERGDFDSATKWEKEAIRLNPAERTGYLANFQKACHCSRRSSPCVRSWRSFSKSATRCHCLAPPKAQTSQGAPMLRSLFVAALTLSASNVLAWSDAGHKTVASIAYR